MSEDLNKKIQQVAELLGQDNMPDNVKDLLSLLAGSLGGKEETHAKTVESEPVKEERPLQSEAGDNSEVLHRVKKVMDKLSTGNDPRINLLYAIKPFMNNKRQKKIANCIQLFQMSSLTRLLDDKEK